LNAQVYNRCIGVRYCGNNCPYTVRFFNWFEPEWDPPLEQQLNPDVTVRSVGVMEKCTFCVQRIRAGYDAAAREGRLVADGEVTPACVQTCPSSALVFGNRKDPDSRVSKLAKEGRSYALLGELGTEPAVTYLSPPE
jgi:Fe-S-cluster-containing dehydrogenase component